MRAVLYISHGTRVKNGVQQAKVFIESCIAQIPLAIQEICFLELVDPSIHSGIERCVQRGATEIIIQPVLLLAAGHVKKDIPKEVREASKDFPDMTFIYSSPFGVDPTIIDILSDRLHEQAAPVLNESMILLVGRGSSDPDIQKDFTKIKNALSTKENLPVKTCFLAACEPRFQEGLQDARVSPYKYIFVVPYLMFTGLLMKEMEEEVGKATSTDKHFYLCESLGEHPNLTKALVNRVESALRAKPASAWVNA